MKTVHIDASRSYCVHIGSGLLNKLGEYVADLKQTSKAILICDSNVLPLYAEVAKKSLMAQGIAVLTYAFPAGEASKNLQTYADIVNFLAQNEVTRADLLIALGGGVTGDLTGFVAATYLRGISFIQVPTTLLAMVDSSVGGKTAVDLPSGKNLVGAFYQPDLVVCDTDTLSTLPKDVFLDGCAEVIKYGILYDEALFDKLAIQGPSFEPEDVICRCVELKRDVVQADEYDSGVRQQLNLGHTIGHAIEKESDFAVSHGHAVAIGTATVARASARLKLCTEATANKICDTLTKFALPTRTHYAPEALYAGTLSDKKRSYNRVNLIVPVKIGKCIIKPTELEDLKTFIQAGI